MYAVANAYKRQVTRCTKCQVAGVQRVTGCTKCHWARKASRQPVCHCRPKEPVQALASATLQPHLRSPLCATGPYAPDARPHVLPLLSASAPRKCALRVKCAAPTLCIACAAGFAAGVRFVHVSCCPARVASAPNPPPRRCCCCHWWTQWSRPAPSCPRVRNGNPTSSPSLEGKATYT